MFQQIAYPAVAYDRYLALMPAESSEELQALAEELKDVHIVHVNSTATGGGVAEILQSLVPITNGLGIHTERLVINPPPQFFQVTKRIHNLLQGAEGCLDNQELDIYFESIRSVAEEMRRRQVTADVWFLHDPQLLPLARMLPRKWDETWVWVGHIDFTTPNRGVLDSLLPLTKDYDRIILSLASYVPDGLGDTLPVSIAPPAIDPLAVKNIPLDQKKASSLVAAMGVDPARPLVCQVSRFDSWKDPWGVIDAYRLARQSVPGLQLALLGLSQASDDLEAVDVVASVTKHAEGDPDIHLYFEPLGLPGTIDEVVNAFQVVPDVIIQKSLREGFGLTVTEAMWKGKAVIGGNVGGIRIQIENGVNGYLVDSPEECASRIVELMKDPKLRSRMGRAARESVRERFLMPSLLLDYLRVVKAHLQQTEAPAPALNHLRMAGRPAVA
jgi:trehalose synthase